MYAIFDTETTGLPNGNDYSKIHMTQLAMIITDGETNFEEIEILINGDYEISEFITKLTGITKEMTIKYGKTFQEAWILINNLMAKYNCKFIIAHNNRFDMSVIKEEYKRLHCLVHNGGSFKNNKMDDNKKLFNEIANKNIFEYNFLNKFRYNNRILKDINDYLNNNMEQSKQKIIEDVFNIYIQNKSQNKMYGEPFFQAVPIDSLNDIFKKELPTPGTRELIKILKNNNIRNTKEFNREQMIETYNQIYINNQIIKNYRLETIHNFLYKEKYIQKHTALDDCWMLQRALNKCSRRIFSYLLK